MPGLQYWEDAADGVRDAEGTLLPLWRFTAERGRYKALTALCWSSDYLDLFAAGYGSYGFLKQCSGLVACFSLKNPSYPEFSCTTDSGAMPRPALVLHVSWKRPCQKLDAAFSSPIVDHGLFCSRHRQSECTCTMGP